jgi:hypothetical protein
MEEAQRRREVKRVERDRQESEELEQKRLEQEAEARALLERMEQERHEEEAQEVIEAAEAAKAAEQAQKEIEGKAEEQCTVEHERNNCEKSEQDRRQQEAKARMLLESMEQEKHAGEAAEAAETAELARKEAEAKVREQQEGLERLEQNRVEQEQINYERLNQERLDREAREAAKTAKNAQREAEEAEAARMAAEQALREPISIENEVSQASPTPLNEREPVAESTRTATPPPAVRTPSRRSIHVPRPQAVTQLMEEDRPPAPSPPVGRVRPRYVISYRFHQTILRFHQAAYRGAFYCLLATGKMDKAIRSYKLCTFPEDATMMTLKSCRIKDSLHTSALPWKSLLFRSEP